VSDDPPYVPDEHHRRPPGVDDATVAAVGKVTEALDCLQRARGRLFDFHQLIGHLDLQLEEAATLLDGAGHHEMATLVREEAVGRNVLDGRWTFQIIEEFEHVYHQPLAAIEQRVLDELVQGRRHLREAEMKEQRRSRGRVAHEARPPAAHDPSVPTEAQR
jgi:hypothetical protein